MNDEGLEFGALREASPALRRRPDRDRHYTSIACGRPAADDLPIFVEFDVWQELIAHACSDTNVELGGVLLGGIYLDDQDQRPFVLITDSLRAEHYEATRGSFKFTHDTWESITRRRDEFAGEVRMVGWYHTHPDWGVFLSSMDLFICNHFFGKPLDVALVLDPCRADWGFFQWTGEPGQPPPRTGGFLLVAARGRQKELERFAAGLSAPGETDMPADPRWSSMSTGSTGPTASPVPVVHIHNPPPNQFAQQAPLWVALLLQTLLIALVAWRVSGAGSGTNGTATSEQPDNAIREWIAAQRVEARLAAQSEVMDRVLSELSSAPDGSFHQLAEMQEENAELTSSVRAQQARERELVAQQANLATKSDRERRAYESKIETARKEQDKLQQKLTDHETRLAGLTQRLKTLDPRTDSADSDSDVAAVLPWYRSPLALFGGVVAAIVAIAASLWFQQRRMIEGTGDDPTDESAERQGS